MASNKKQGGQVGHKNTTLKQVAEPTQVVLIHKLIQLILMRSDAEAMQFAIDGPQYDIDRAAFSEGRFYFDPVIGEVPIRHAISTKRASLVKGYRNLTHFAKYRPQVEQRHRLKLIQKGFEIIE